MWPNPRFLMDFFTFTEEICNGKLHFLYSIYQKWHKSYSKTILTRSNQKHFPWNSYITLYFYCPRNFLETLHKNFPSIDTDATETYILSNFNINMYGKITILFMKITQFAGSLHLLMLKGIISFFTAESNWFNPQL